MKKMSFLFKQLQLMVILTMSIAITACSDDNSQNDNNPTNPEANIKIITNGIEGNTINVGQIVQLSVQKEAIDDELTYEWYVNNEGISTEETCSFLATEQGEYNIRIIASAGDKGWATTLTLEATPYPGKFCIINEGRYNASVNLYEAGKISTLTNALGITGTVGRLNGNNLYVVTKSSPQLSCIDSTTGTIIKQLSIDGQGSDFQLINETTGVLSSTTGIYIINLNDLSVQYRLSTERNCKDLYIANNYLFTLEENAIKVYNTSDFSFEKALAHSAVTGFAQTLDGSLWAGNSDKFIRINTSTLESEEYPLPANMALYYNQWAYTPTGLQASTTENALYFAQQVEAGYSIYGKDIYKYDLTTGNATLFFTTPAEDKSIYASGIQVNPNTGDVYLIYTEDGWGEHYLNTYIYMADGRTGTQKAIIDYSGEYWFPSTLVFLP